MKFFLMECVDFVCSYAACCEFLQQNNLLSIIRAHEAQDAGYVHFGTSFLHFSKSENESFARAILLMLSTCHGTALSDSSI